MIIKKYITYAGIENPKTEQELKVEICGLENSILIAKELISRYKQIFAIMELKRGETTNVPKTGTVENSEGESRAGAEGIREAGEEDKIP
jgi:hypothetical protein